MSGLGSLVGSKLSWQVVRGSELGELCEHMHELLGGEPGQGSARVSLVSSPRTSKLHEHIHKLRSCELD